MALECATGEHPPTTQTILYHTILLGPIIDPAADELYDVHKSLKLQVCKSTRVPIPCLASSTRLWLVGSRRGVSGLESLLMQGWDIHDFRPDPKCTESVLFGLSGNAMNGYVLSSLFLSMFIAIDWSVPFAASDAVHKARLNFASLAEDTAAAALPS